MDRPLRLVTVDEPRVSLRAIGPGDLEDLRVWKNANKDAFFFKDEITPEMQKRWYEGYRSRPQDFMFVVESRGKRCGSMGFRLEGGGADCYNIMGVPECRGTGVMGQAMRLMCSYVQSEHAKRIGCKVIKTNPAVDWYKRCGYRVTAEKTDHVVMELDVAVFRPCAYGQEAA